MSGLDATFVVASITTPGVAALALLIKPGRATNEVTTF
jgi:hypothetical protein